jgi:hypothetical protein
VLSYYLIIAASVLSYYLIIAASVLSYYLIIAASYAKKNPLPRPRLCKLPLLIDISLINA